VRHSGNRLHVLNGSEEIRLLHQHAGGLVVNHPSKLFRRNRPVGRADRYDFGADAFYELYASGRYAPADVLDGLGQDNFTEQLSFKPWPACRGTHAYIQIALMLQREHGFTANDVTGIELATGPVQQMLVTPAARKQAPATAIDAKFSIPYTVAVALVRGAVTLEDFDAAARTDVAILELAARITATLEPDWTTDHATRGALTIRLRDGRTVSAQVDEPLGSPAAPLSDDALVEKFVDCCAHAARPLRSTDALAAAERILAIDAAKDSGACFRLWSE
jgi:2-methylcitrate dehydratase PrpD